MFQAVSLNCFYISDFFSKNCIFKKKITNFRSVGRWSYCTTYSLIRICFLRKRHLYMSILLGNTGISLRDIEVQSGVCLKKAGTQG